MVEESKTEVGKKSAQIGVDELASLTANLSIDRRKKKKDAPQISVKSKKISKREKREKQKKVQCRR